MKGDLEPSSRLVLAEVARELGFSRTPIREALRRLESEGLVNSVPNSGFTVADFLEDLGDIFLIRGRLEGLAAFMAAGRITVEELQRLEDLQQQMEHELTLADVGVQRLISWNSEFHRTMLLACRSKRLERTIEQLLPDAVSAQIIAIYTADEMRESVEQHRAILRCLWDRDATVAEALVQRHMMMGRKAMERLRGDPASAHRDLE